MPRFGYETNNSGSRKKLRIKPGSGYRTLLVFEFEPKHLDAARIPIVDPDGSKIFADPSESATRVDNARMRIRLYPTLKFIQS